MITLMFKSTSENVVELSHERKLTFVHFADKLINVKLCMYHVRGWNSE